ncbi:hypothetical protein [Streptomyces sasae]|uniref:hypothetical protein n=1 Tax=Streptomyces sasae TaxID=1266772 RepID=UPI0029305EBA|nr:hypothetical protein [Streptomyces sasae]
MFQTSPGPRFLGRTAGMIGALALVALGATPAAADGPAPGVVLGRLAPVDGAEPGSSFQVPAQFTNTGAEALGKVWLSYTLTRGLSLTELPSNCSSLEIPTMDEIPNKTEAVCEFDQTVKPGVVYAPEKQLTFDVLDYALYDDVTVGIDTSGFPYPGDNFSHPEPGSGPAIRLVEQPDATPAAPGSAKRPSVDVADVPVTAANTADFQVTGARLEGAVGDTVPLKVKITNAGPAWVYRRDRATAARVLIKMPAGTTVAKSDNYCIKAGSGTYTCSNGYAWVPETYKQTFTFELKIDKAVSGAEGSIELTGRSRPFDTHAANDKAGIRLDVTGGDGASGGGASPTASTAASGTSGGDGLANTGSGTALPLAGAAAAAVALGAGALLAARRRANGR